MTTGGYSVIRVLVAEADEVIRRSVMRSLERYGYCARGVGTASAAISESDSAEILLIDIDLPDEDGLRVCEKVRRRADVVIIAFSNRLDEIDYILALRAGADHCVPKNTGIREIIARIEAVRRRVDLSSLEVKNHSGNLSSTVNGSDLEIDRATCTVTLDSRVLTMTRKEFDLLSLLIETKGKNVPRSTIMERVWHDDSGVQTRTIDTHVNNLRRKIGRRESITCTRGVGYRFLAS